MNALTNIPAIIKLVIFALADTENLSIAVKPAFISIRGALLKLWKRLDCCPKTQNACYADHKRDASADEYES